MRFLGVSLHGDGLGDGDELVVVAPVRTKRRWGSRVPPFEVGRRADAIRDLAHAVQELTEARDEMAAIPTDLRKLDRDRALADPLSRVDLVRRFCVEVLDRYRWSPDT